MVERAREQGELKMVADQRLAPTFTADLAPGAGRSGGCARPTGILHLTASGICSWFEFTEAIIALAGIDVPVEPVATTRAPGGADRPLNGALARPAADALGLAPLRHWRDALADYMGRAGLIAAAAGYARGR